jgi:hypothetical protein
MFSETTKMHEDNILLVFGFIFYWIVLAFLTVKSENKTKTLTINIILHIAYSSYFLYGLFFLSEGGTALGWFFYLLLILIAHILVNIGQIVYISKKQNNG